MLKISFYHLILQAALMFTTAHTGARSGQGREFSLSITTESIGVGLSEQVKAFQNRKDFTKPRQM